MKNTILTTCPFLGVHHNDLDYKIANGRLYFNTDVRVNALARTQRGYHLVEINKGALYWMHRYYLGKEVLFDDARLNHFRTLTQQKGIDPGFFLFQFLTIYYFYHEVGHLIQIGDVDIDTPEYMDHECQGDDVSIHHMHELDADWYAAHCMAIHIKQFAEIETAEGIRIDPSSVSEIAALALSAVYTYFINQSGRRPEIYYQEKCHPHPSVRLTYMIIFFLDNLKANLTEEIDNGFILRRAIQISEILIDEKDNEIVKGYSMALNEELDKVESYIKVIMKNAENYPFLCKHILPSK